MSLKICFISDTHNQLHKVNLPEADVLVHAGDATFQGLPSEIEHFSAKLFDSFDRYDKIIFVPGNHDRLFQTDIGKAKSLLPDKVITLVDECYLYKDCLFYGSPWSAVWGMAYHWAFQEPAAELKKKWDRIPLGADVVITHGPPYLLGDKVGDRNEGCPRLREVVEQSNMTQVHAFGHIHEGYGVYGFDSGKMAVNASLVGGDCLLRNEPIVITIHPNGVYDGV